MPISTNSEPTRHANDPEATPGPSCDAASRPTTPPAPHRSTPPPATRAQSAPPTPPAAAPSSAGTPNAAGSTALRRGSWPAAARRRDLAVRVRPVANLGSSGQVLEAAGEQLDDHHQPGALAALLEQPQLLLGRELDPGGDGVGHAVEVGREGGIGLVAGRLG